MPISNIEALLPHTEPMLLIESVLDWNDESIYCDASSHHNSDNPLCINGKLSTINGLEYAAQAMAAHTKLTSEDELVRKGFIAVASKIQCHSEFLDSNPGKLLIKATKSAVMETSSEYTFSIESDGQKLIEGQLLAVLTE